MNKTKCPRCEEMVRPGAHTCQAKPISQEDAVKVAKWLGEDSIYEARKKYYAEGGDSGLLLRLDKFLLSPEGQEAIMDKLEDEGWEVTSKNLAPENHAKTILVTLKHDDCSLLSGYQTIKTINKTDSTRQLALIKAVLAMLKGGG